MQARHVLSVALGLLAGVACGGEARTELTPMEAFMVDYARALCAASSRCCPDSPSAQRFCVGDMQDLGFDLDAARTDLYAYEPEAAQRCLSELEATDICDAGALPIVCHEVFVGALGPGESCQTNIECRAPAPLALPSCELQADGVKKCVAAAEEGSACKYTCDVDGVCYFSASGQGNCYTSLGFHCSPVTGTCDPQQALGEPCEHTLECASGACIDAACTELPGEGDSCSHSAPCGHDTFCVDSICSPSLRAGEACSADGEPPCKAGCVDGRCGTNTPLCH